MSVKLSGSKNIVLKAVAFLSLLIMLPTSAEVDHSLDYLTGGRSFAGGIGGSNNLNNLNSACGVNRGGARAINLGGGGGVGAQANGQGGFNSGDGLIQASIPPGALNSTLPGATIFMNRCLSCHANNGVKVTAAKGIARTNPGAAKPMPEPPQPPLSAQEKKDLDAFFNSGAI